MAVTLADFALAINLVSECPWFDLASPCAQSHGTAQLFHAAQFAKLVDDTMRRCWIEFAGIRFGQSRDVARKLDASGLHSQADAEIRDLLLASVADGLQHAFDTAFGEPA